MTDVPAHDSEWTQAFHLVVAQERKNEPKGNRRNMKTVRLSHRVS